MKILACSSNIELAKKISKILKWDLVQADIKKFSDGEVFVEIKENVRGDDIFVIQSTSQPAGENLMELTIALDALRRASAKSVNVVIPYFGYARQDRKTSPRSPITAKLVANLIQTAGADRILTMDLHASQIQGFFDIPVDNLYAQTVFANHLKNSNPLKIDLKNISVASPDVGGIARARAFAKIFDASLTVIDKRREKAGISEVMNIIGDVQGKNIIIVDDIIDSGGTLCNCAKALLDNGAKSVISYITHGVLSGNAIKNLSSSGLEKIYITDTINIPNEKLKCNKIEIVSVANMFAEAIRRTLTKESISSLFN